MCFCWIVDEYFSTQSLHQPIKFKTVSIVLKNPLVPFALGLHPKVCWFLQHIRPQFITVGFIMILLCIGNRASRYGRCIMFFFFSACWQHGHRKVIYFCIYCWFASSARLGILFNFQQNNATQLLYSGSAFAHRVPIMGFDTKSDSSLKHSERKLNISGLFFSLSDSHFIVWI